MPTKRGYITAAKFTDLTNLSVTDIVEWDRQADLAERYVDLVCGPEPRFHPPRTLTTITSATSNTFVSPELDNEKDDYYNNLRVEIKQNTGSGYDGFVTDYDADTTTLTVSGSFSSNPDSTSTMIVTQRAVFPRIRDFDADGRPVILEAVTEAVAYAIEYAVTKGGSAGFNANAFSDTGTKEAERMGDYFVKYSSSQDRESINQIGIRAYQTLQQAGLIKRVGQLI